MKTFFLTIGLIIGITATASAQWQETTYNLKGGWNAIYLHGDATHATPDVLFAAGDAANIEEIWRWNPNPSQIQFTVNPLIPSPGTPEWSVWYRTPSGGQISSLTEMVGQSAYLIKCSGTAASSYSVDLTYRPIPPATTWVRHGANLLGFPSLDNGSFPTFSNYFATFPAAIAANSKIFKYTGGDLGPANPLQIFSPSFEPLDRNQAYWFEAEVTGRFHAPIEVAPAAVAGLDFGRTGSLQALRLRNRTDAPVTVTLTPVTSDTAPSGEESITGPVPLTRRTFNTGTLLYEETPIVGAINEVIAPQSSIEIEFGIDRSAMSANSQDFYASLLQITESSNLMDVFIPTTARVGSLAGLWIGDTEVSAVTSTVAGSPGDTTPRPFPLRYILHIDDGGTPRILSQVFIGTLAAAPNDWGLCTDESLLKADSKTSATRLSAAHLPLDQTLSTGTGSVALGSTLERQIVLGFETPSNPFVHKFHPDHNNKSPRGDDELPGVESYNVTRSLTFEFLATPPAGTSATGWGTTVLGGNYSETISGVHRDDLSVSGTFTLRRVNDIGTISTP